MENKREKLIYSREVSKLKTMKNKSYIGERKVINLSSNDYLSLSIKKEVINSACDAIKKLGTSSSGSRLMGGGLVEHINLEEKIANWIGHDKAILFGNGTMCNMGVISSLAGQEDYILADRLNHASLIDGAILSGAKIKRFTHSDISSLKKQIQITKKQILDYGKENKSRIFIITESLFSMDGDITPLKEIKKLADSEGAFLIVDESHSIGIFGNQGEGLCKSLNIKPNIITASCGKALGSYGGICACNLETYNLIVNNSRTFIFTSAMEPSSIGAINKVIDLLKAESKSMNDLLIQKKEFFVSSLIKNLQKNPEIEIEQTTSNSSKEFFISNKSKNGDIIILSCKTQIISIIFGEEERTVKVSNFLNQEGIFVKPIRPPSVPSQKCRIRATITLLLSDSEISFSAEKIAKSIFDSFN